MGPERQGETLLIFCGGYSKTSVPSPRLETHALPTAPKGLTRGESSLSLKGNYLQSLPRASHPRRVSLRRERPSGSLASRGPQAAGP